MGKRIGFVSTRFAGTDGVSLESSKWAGVLRQAGHQCFWFAGELDRAPERSFLAPEAHFRHEEMQWINARIFGGAGRGTDVTDRIHALRSFLRQRLHEFITAFDIQVIIAQNVLTIPMHVPLGLALTECLAETQIPCIAHHHDFYWERTRFSRSAVPDYLRTAFPPILSNIQHAVINSAAQEELALRTGISSFIIPNVLDFETPPVIDPDHARAFRQSIGLTPDDIMILQPTRIIPRKGIEHAIELVHELNEPAVKLVISHEAGDEGFEYADWLKEYAKSHGVDLRVVNARLADPENENGRPADQYSLWEIYAPADFITYPSLYEGFGNAFLEAIYHRKPMLINRYAIFVQDIEPRGFDLAVMDGYLTRQTVDMVREVLSSPARRERMVNHNYETASRYYSYAALRRTLNTMMINFFGMDV